MKNPPSENQGTDMSLPPAKKGRTSEDFLKFCKFILDYENYDAIRRDEKLRSRSRSPPNSSESGFESSKSDRPRSSTRRRALRPESPVQKRVVKRSTPSLSVQAKEIETSSSSTESDTEAEGYNDVTCYCGKPYAGRPMIECTNCLTWLHISCAKVKRTNIPEIFICSQCTGHESQSPDHTMPSNRSFSGSRNARNRAGDL